jgi:hypothetical protein
LLLRDFEFDLDYPTIRLEGEISKFGNFTPQDGIAQTGADFVEIRFEEVVHLDLWNITTGYVVGLKGTQADIYIIQDGEITIDTSPYRRVYLIIQNLEQASQINDCKISPYSFRVESGEEATSPDYTIPAPHFQTPSVEQLLDPDNYSP